jgi:hypothetical protein
MKLTTEVAEPHQGTAKVTVSILGDFAELQHLRDALACLFNGAGKRDRCVAFEEDNLIVQVGLE